MTLGVAGVNKVMSVNMCHLLFIITHLHVNQASNGDLMESQWETKSGTAYFLNAK